MDKTIELVNGVKDIQAMPSVIVRALNIMKKPTASMKELGDIVMFDRVANSQIFSTGKFSILWFFTTNIFNQYCAFSAWYG